ncbi:MAG: hypothetical protein EOM53_01380 [Alphaproteobacteria bacterium]|nr:hypothetical protein [Alphaproteobacteria bacterium]
MPRLNNKLFLEKENQEQKQGKIFFLCFVFMGLSFAVKAADSLFFQPTKGDFEGNAPFRLLSKTTEEKETPSVKEEAVFEPAPAPLRAEFQVEESALPDLLFDYVGQKNPSVPANFYKGMTFLEFEKELSLFSKTPLSSSAKELLSSILLSKTEPQPLFEFKASDFLKKRVEMLLSFGRVEDALFLINQVDEKDLNDPFLEEKVSLLFALGKDEEACAFLPKIKENSLFRYEAQLSCFDLKGQEKEKRLALSLGFKGFEKEKGFKSLLKGEVKEISSSKITPVMLPLLSKNKVEIKLEKEIPSFLYAFMKQRDEDIFFEEKIRALEEIGTLQETKEAYLSYGKGLSLKDSLNPIQQRAASFSTLFLEEASSKSERAKALKILISYALEEKKTSKVFPLMASILSAQKNLSLQEEKVKTYGLLFNHTPLLLEKFYQVMDKKAFLSDKVQDKAPLLEKRMSRAFEQNLLYARKNWQRAKAIFLSLEITNQGVLEREAFQSLKLFGFEKEAQALFIEKLCEDEFIR